MKKAELAKKIDHTMLGPEVTRDQVEEGVAYAKELGTASVCVSPDRLKLVADLLQGSDVLACTVVGFPHGTQTAETKVAETKQALADGAQEIDMVMNVGHLLEGNVDYVKNEIEAVVQAAGVTTKVIIETACLTDQQIVQACQLAEEAGAAFVKTSTGYASDGAKVEDVRLMRETVSDQVSVKASGGIRTLDDCLAMIEAGADRIGASRTTSILADLH